jgi:hypothetical protein
MQFLTSANRYTFLCVFCLFHVTMNFAALCETSWTWLGRRKILCPVRKKAVYLEMTRHENFGESSTSSLSATASESESELVREAQAHVCLSSLTCSSGCNME